MSQPLHDSSLHLVYEECLATEGQQVPRHDAVHTCPAALDWCCLHSRCRMAPLYQSRLS